MSNHNDFLIKILEILKVFEIFEKMDKWKRFIFFILFIASLAINLLVLYFFKYDIFGTLGFVKLFSLSFAFVILEFILMILAVMIYFNLKPKEEKEIDHSNILFCSMVFTFFLLSITGAVYYVYKEQLPIGFMESFFNYIESQMYKGGKAKEYIGNQGLGINIFFFMFCCLIYAIDFLIIIILWLWRFIVFLGRVVLRPMRGIKHWYSQKLLPLLRGLLRRRS